MQENFYRMIGQIGIFMICAQAIIHFRPRESYAKYLKMLLSMMIVVQIFQPFANFFLGGTAGEFQEQIVYFQQELEVRMRMAEESARLSEEKLEKMTLLEVQERIQEQVVEENDVDMEQFGNGEGGVAEKEWTEKEEVLMNGESAEDIQGGEMIDKVEIRVEWDASMNRE